jgi:serine phosphatase RsbU (regulator of sigma subunit)/anti-sigma regulatory factor (Ser/Thr protein kinase)
MAPPSSEPAREDGKGGLEAALGGASLQFRRRLGAGAIVVVTLVVGISTLLAWRQYDDEKKKSLVELQARVVLASNVFDTYFAGQLSLLSSVAAAPSVVESDRPAMRVYFARLEAGRAKTFTGGIGWIDRQGISRLSTNPQIGPAVSVADRSYFKAVVSTGAPFVSEGLVTRRANRRVVIMAVPTRDSTGRLTGVLAGALELRASPTDQRSIDLGFGGLITLDRARQQITLASFARPTNAAILPRIKNGEGVLVDVDGLDGSSGRVVAYANSKAPGWTTVIDRPASTVFAPAREGLVLELVVIGGAAFAVLCIIGWALMRSRHEQEAERLQIRQWDELSQSLGDASATGEVSLALGAALSTAFPEARVIVAVREDDSSGLTVSTFEPPGAERLSSDDPSVGAIAALASEATDHVALAGAELEPVLGQSIAELKPAMRSLYGLPLRTQSGRPTGSMTLLLPDDRALSAAEESLLVAHAEHASRALARARRHEREHDVAIALQRSLLPEALPAIEGLDFAGRYNAGGVGLAVGGDWYDAVRRPDGMLHLTVGDVAGRGISAAVLMGQLRNAFRALAYDHTSPAEIARRLTRLVPLDGMATAVFLTIDPYTGEVAYASTGHPPSLLLDLEATTVTRLDQANAPPLGWAAADEISEARLTLPANGAVLAYTDGLVERRGSSIDDGIDRLAELLRDGSQLSAAEAADRLLDYLVIPLSATDDIALLLVRHVGVPSVVEIEIPADSTLMHGVRTRLRTWLGRRGFGEEQQTDAVLAVSEACNNAIEHGYSGRTGTIKLRFEHRADLLTFTIEDEGIWRTPEPDPTRGRGTLIMKATMDRTSIAHNGSGTRVELELKPRFEAL